MSDFLSSDRHRVIVEHRYLCSRAARKFVRDGLERGDLEQVAALGLIKAVDRFDPQTGVPFDGYAWVLILGELMHYVRDHERLVRAPRRVRELERRWNAAEAELTAALGREPRSHDVAKFIGASAKDASEVQVYRSRAHVASVESLQGRDQRAHSYSIDRHVDRLALETSMRRLSAAERRILNEIYERDTPVNLLARRMGYSRRHVSRLHQSALKKLAGIAMARGVRNGALRPVARTS